MLAAYGSSSLLNVLSAPSCPIRTHAPEFVFSIASPTTRPLGAASLALLELIRAHAGRPAATTA